MNEHLTEQQLIDYQFKLADETGMQEARAHLAACEACRQRLDALSRKFASLDLLRDEIKASDALIAKTVAHAASPASAKSVPRHVIGLRGLSSLVMSSAAKRSRDIWHRRQRTCGSRPDPSTTLGVTKEGDSSRNVPASMPWFRLPWLGAAAAAVIVGFAVLLTNWDRKPPQYETAKSLQPQPAPTMAKEESAAIEPERFVAADSRAAGSAVDVEGLRGEGVPPLRPAGIPSAGSGQALPAERERGQDALATKEQGQDALATKDKGKLVPSEVEGMPSPRENHRQAALDAATRPPGAVTTSMLDAAPQMRADALDDKPPFAPASAIELVVLPRRENVQLTIYNAADLTLVRERRNLTLKRGWNWLQFMWANTLIDPTSLTLEPLRHKDQVEVRQLVFPPRLRELGRWLIRSETEGQVPFEITYLTSGLVWRAFYMGTLSQDEKTMRLEAYVRVDNHSGEDYEDAQTRLIVGKVHLLDQIRDLAQRQYPYGSPLPIGRRSGAEGVEAWYEGKKVPILGDVPLIGKDLDAYLGRKEIRKEGLSEYFLYTIEGTDTIPNEWGKRLLSLEADEIPVKALYKYDEERWGTETIQFLSFANDQEHKLGETPLPDGMVRIYGHADEQGHLSYVGGTDVKYIPVGEEVELNLGPAQLVEVEPVLMDHRTENYVFDPDGNITGWDEIRTWKVEVANARMVPIDVEVTRGFETPYWTLTLGQKRASYEKYDATHARFRLTLEPREKWAFEYTVTTYHGTREQILAEKEKRE